MIYDEFFDSFDNLFAFVTLVEKWWFWAQKHDFHLRTLYFCGKQTNSLFFLRNWNFGKFRCFFIPHMLKWHEKSQFYVLLKFRHDFIFVLKNPFFWPLVHPIFVIKKSEVRVSKKFRQNLSVEFLLTHPPPFRDFCQNRRGGELGVICNSL